MIKITLAFTTILILGIAIFININVNTYKIKETGYRWTYKINTSIDNDFIYKSKYLCIKSLSTCTQLKTVKVNEDNVYKHIDLNNNIIVCQEMITDYNNQNIEICIK
jgi:hypothetical protein